jgi:hypothetical protein
MMAGSAADEQLPCKRRRALAGEGETVGLRSLAGLAKEGEGGVGNDSDFKKFLRKVLTVASKRCNNLASALNEQTARRNKRQVIGRFCEVL